MSVEFWDQSFSVEEFIYGKRENAFINEMSNKFLKKSFTIGCFAEGEGRNAVFLAQQGHDVTVYDQSAVGLQKARQLAEEMNVQINVEQCDLTKEEVTPDQFDVAVMVFGHVPKQNQAFFMKNIADSVKPGGYIIFEVYSENQLNYQTGGPNSIEMLYNPVDILKWAEGYKCLHFYYGEADRQEGDRHNGLSHVIQVAMQK
ncbi:class I SAM-dependent methyltransferase [Pontibacillus litoralis]|uniref:Methyltransferase n=1 Tax=Pontibacillus litoralis JSM 072002 TaxID=1385512 RepID=A0A0A5FVE6_9BACI|nr:class I SAM-dependent methyltransferase [Pontibacillus litoralis]KGX84776.1 methyltransferase [Pontibacillus litoralis JSM 072002]